MKKIFIVIGCLCLFAGLFSGILRPVSAEAAQPVALVSRTVPVYINGAENKQDLPLYFSAGGDIPFISLEDWEGILNLIGSLSDPVYQITSETDGDIFRYVRETGYSADFNFADNTIYFTDRNEFSKKSSGYLFALEENGETAELFQRSDSSFSRHGKDTMIDLGDYGIPMYVQDGRHFIPLQTFSDILLTARSEIALFNGECIIITDGMTETEKEIYYSAPKQAVSSEFGVFNYNELCMALDNLYGLSEAHGITSFRDVFHKTALDQILSGTDITAVDKTLYAFINFYIDDLHSSYGTPSYNSDRESVQAYKMNIGRGSAFNKLYEYRSDLRSARASYYPEGIPAYEEVGNTAYITFDHFEDAPEGTDYNTLPGEDELDYAIRLMQYACSRILREDSPVQNVVVDLSNNTGGSGTVASYVIGTFLGRSMISMKDVQTGALLNAVSNIDTNMDHQFDEMDTLAGKGLKFFCFTSPVSFSCGNLVPCVFRESGKVALIGRTTGGGSCNVQILSTASGTAFQVSGPYQISFLKNGSFYDADRGTDPDIYIYDMSKLYDREYMTEFINSIR